MEEKDKKKEREEHDEGHSEKQQDLDVEIKAGEWQNLKKFKTYQNRSRQGKIIATYQAISNRLNQLIVLYYKFVAGNPLKAAKMLEELRRLRFLQEILLNCLVWEQKDELSKGKVPDELWELIK